MPGKAASELLDLAKTTLDNLPDNIYEAMWDNHDYEFARIYREANRQEDSGKAIVRNVQLDAGGNARYRKLYDVDQPGVTDTQEQVTVPWAQIGTNWSYDVFELKMNTGAAGFINLIESRRNAELWGYANLFEDRGWKTPNSSSDNTNPYGVPYFLPFLDDGSTTAGFNAKTIRFGDGTTTTTAAGLDANTHDKWRSYAATYTSVDNQLLRTIRRAVRLTKFKPPKNLGSVGQPGEGPQKSFYADIDVVTELEDLADKRDDNNSSDDLMGGVSIRGTDAGTFINRMPLVYIDQLDDMTIKDGGSNDFSPEPIYCIDWSFLQPVTFEGHWMEQTDTMTSRDQHTVMTVFVDSAHQNLCINRRRAGFVIHKEIPAA